MVSSALHAGSNQFSGLLCFHSVVKFLWCIYSIRSALILITYLQRHHHLCTQKKKKFYKKNGTLLFFRHVPNEIVPIQLFP
jgi:hypothetical protein